MQRSNTMSLDAMQKIINSFRQVERKIDKLQDDFCAQNKTLNDLRIMVGNLQTGNQSLADNEDSQRSKPEKQLDLTSHGSLKHKQPQSPKVLKAKSYEPVVPKNQFGAKRPLKAKKAEVKKATGRGRSARKPGINDIDSGIRGRVFQH